MSGIEQPNLEAVAAAWVAHQREEEDATNWAVGSAYELVTAAEDTAWELVLRVVDQIADDESLLCDLGAGPLEDAVKTFGLRFIARLKEEARTRPALVQAASCLWTTIGELNDEIDSLLAEHGVLRR